MMMPNMNQMTSLGGPGGNNGQSYSYSSVMSYSNNGGAGEPKYFEATSSTRQGPGGVKETRKTVRDSESGLNKMAVGHHINDRGHVVERSMNRRTNQRDEHQNFIGMDEADAGRFNEEWSRATVNLGNHPQMRGIENGVVEIGQGTLVKIAETTTQSIINVRLFLVYISTYVKT